MNRRFSRIGASHIPATALLVLIFFSGCEGCAKEIEKNLVNDISYFGSTSTAGGTVVSFLRARRDGHAGEQYWREPVAPSYARTPYSVPIAPKDWKVMHVESGPDDGWVLLRFRIESATGSGLPVEKLWDFCLHKTVEGFRIAAVGDAGDQNVGVCEASLSWKKFDYAGTKPKASGTANK
jgi:hypothetical protein